MICCIVWAQSEDDLRTENNGADSVALLHNLERSASSRSSSGVWWCANNYWLLGALVMLVSMVLFAYRMYLSQKTLKKQVNKAFDTVREQQRTIEQQEALKSTFFANISHEMRTPLTLIQGDTDAILRVNKLSPQAVEPAGKIKTHVKKMISMVNSLLDLPNEALDTLQVTLKPVYLDTLMERFVQAFLTRAEGNQIDVCYMPDVPEMMAVEVDETQIQKIVDSLVYNSFKYVDSEGKIDIYTMTIGQRVVMKFTTDGSQVEAREVPLVLDRFYLGEADDDTHGMGLAVAKELLEPMNGQLEFANNPNKGVQISVSWPISELVPSIESELISSEELKEGRAIPNFKDLLKVPSDTSVLIVEDNKLLRAYLSDVLSDDFELHTASNGQEALNLLKQVKPDLILTDVMMPVMNGWELIENIRKDMALSKIPVIVLTAVAANSDRIKGLRLGVDDYIIKPFEVEELLIRINNLINNLRERIKWAREFGGDPKKDLTEEHQLVLKIREFVKTNMGDRKLNVTQLALYLGLSERQLYRKTAEAVGLSPSKLITEIRMQHARELLVTKRFDKLAQISQEIGFESTAHFSKLYLERFGKKPLDYFA